MKTARRHRESAGSGFTLGSGVRNHGTAASFHPPTGRRSRASSPPGGCEVSDAAHRERHRRCGRTSSSDFAVRSCWQSGRPTLSPTPAARANQRPPRRRDETLVSRRRRRLDLPLRPDLLVVSAERGCEGAESTACGGCTREPGCSSLLRVTREGGGGLPPPTLKQPINNKITLITLRRLAILRVIGYSETQIYQ